MLRLLAGGARALAEEAFRTGSSKVDWDDYSSNSSDDSSYEAHVASIDDLRYSEPYRDDIDCDARHPSPFCPSVESGAEDCIKSRLLVGMISLLDKLVARRLRITAWSQRASCLCRRYCLRSRFSRGIAGVVASNF